MLLINVYNSLQSHVKINHSLIVSSAAVAASQEEGTDDKSWK